MKIESSSTRRWYQLHRSSWFVFTLVLIVLVAVNLPYDYSQVAQDMQTIVWNRFYGSTTEFLRAGWPLRYMNVQTPDDSEYPEYKWSTVALAGDLLVGILLLATVVGACEQRRRRRMLRWQLSLSDLCFLMLVVCCVFGTWSMMAHRYRTQQTAIYQVGIDGGYVTTQFLLPKIIIGPEEPSPWRGQFHAWLVNQLWNHERPTATRLAILNEQTMSAVRQLGKIETLVIDDPTIKDDAVELLEPLRYLERLQLDGEHLTDACVPSLQRLSRLRYLRVSNARFSDDAISKLAALPDWASLDVEGTPLADRGLAAIAAHRRLRELNIARTNVSAQGLRVLDGHPNLSRLWLASAESKPDSPAVKRVELRNLPRLKMLHLPSQLESLELSNMPSLTQLPDEWEPNDLLHQSWISWGGSRQMAISPYPQPMEFGITAKHVALRDMPRLTTLNLDCRTIESLELDIASLQNLSTTRTNDYRQFKKTHDRYVIGDRLCELIGRNKALQALSLVDASASRYGWKQLSSLRELRSLDLSGSNVTDKDLGAFAPANKLESLSLVDTQIGNDGWDNLPRLAHLQSLDLSGTRIKQLDLEDISELETLKIGNMPLESLRLKNLPKLKGYLELASSAPLVVEVDNLPMLTGIQLGAQHIERMVLENLPSLMMLELRGSTVDDSMLRDLGQWTQLQSLGLGDTKITDTTLRRIGELHQLDRLDVENTAITDEGLAAIGPRIPLTVLNLTGTNLSDHGLRHLSEQKHLSHLYLGRTHVNGPGLRHLSNLTSLRKLSLGETSVTSDSLVHLQSMQELEWLRLSDTKIDDTSFQHLSRLTNLRSLFLNGTSVTDQGMRTFSLPRNLKELDVANTAVTADEAIGIERKRGRLKVNR